MKNNKINLAIIALIGVFMTSCVSSRKMQYFKEVEGLEVSEHMADFETKIQVGDLLGINVSSVDAETAIPFNIYETPLVGTSVSNSKPLPYLVNKVGEINFPVLGKIKVVGLSTRELTNTLEEALLPYIKVPIVNVRIQNFKITVLGEVKTPGTFKVEDERISILEAIGLAGDLTIQGKRTTVTLIRVRDGKRELIPIDLTNQQLFNSPYYYLAQNDVLYITPNKAKMNSSIVGANTSIIFSSISTLIAIIAIITR